MRFAKTVFWIAGSWGVLLLTPMYFMFDSIGRFAPPAANHPEIFFGFLGVTMAWQAAFFVIGSDPVRYRPIMVAAVLEKFAYVAALVVLSAQNRIGFVQALPGIPDAILGVLFTVAFFKLRSSERASR